VLHTTQESVVRYVFNNKDTVHYILCINAKHISPRPKYALHRRKLACANRV
jgi:hypothetical protein